MLRSVSSEESLAGISRRKRIRSSGGANPPGTARISVRSGGFITKCPVSLASTARQPLQQSNPACMRGKSSFSPCPLRPLWPRIEYGNRCGRTRLIAGPRRPRPSGALVLLLCYALCPAKTRFAKKKSATACRRFPVPTHRREVCPWRPAAGLGFNSCHLVGRASYTQARHRAMGVACQQNGRGHSLSQASWSAATNSSVRFP